MFRFLSELNENIGEFGVDEESNAKICFKTSISLLMALNTLQINFKC